MTAAESMKSALLIKFDCQKFVTEAKGHIRAECCLKVHMSERYRSFEPDLSNFMPVFYGH